MDVLQPYDQILMCGTDLREVSKGTWWQTYVAVRVWGFDTRFYDTSVTKDAAMARHTYKSGL